MAAYGSARYGYGPWGFGEASAALTGNSSTSAVGTLLADRSIQEDRTVATGNVGTVSLSVSIAITGNSATGAVQSLFVSPIITGNSATGATGTMLAEVISFQAITGVGGTGSAGTATSTVSIAIIGVQTACSVGTLIGFGWGAVPDTSETWSTISDTSETWTVVADNSTTWQEAA